MILDVISPLYLRARFPTSMSSPWIESIPWITRPPSPLEPRSKLSAIDFSIRWNLFFQNLNGVTHAQAFHKLRASSCTRKLRASPKSRKHFKHKFKSKLIYNEKGYTTWWLLWRKPTFEQSVGFGLGLQELLREIRASFAQAKGFLATMPPSNR